MSSRRNPLPPVDGVDVEAAPQAPNSRVNRRKSVAAALHDQEQEYEQDSRQYEMQQADEISGTGQKIDLARLQTMGVVQKLNKASHRSRLEGKALFVQKLCIFFAVSGLVLGIIEQETLWCVSIVSIHSSMSLTTLQVHVLQSLTNLPGRPPLRWRLRLLHQNQPTFRVRLEKCQ